MGSCEYILCFKSSDVQCLIAMPFYAFFGWRKPQHFDAGQPLILGEWDSADTLIQTRRTYAGLGASPELIGAACGLRSISRTHQRYSEGVAIGTRSKIHLPPHAHTDAPNDGQSQTKPRLFDIRTRLSPDKRFEKPLLLLWRNRVAMIGNDDARTRLSHFDLSFMRVGERILDEVRHHSAQKKR